MVPGQEPFIFWTLTISFLGPNTWCPVHRPLIAWVPAIDFLDPSHSFLGPQPLISWTPSIDFLGPTQWSPRHQPLIPGHQPLGSWAPAIDFQTPTSDVLDHNLWFPGLQPLTSGHPPARRSAIPVRRLKFNATAPPHATGCRPIIAFHPAIAAPTRAILPLSIPLSHRGCWSSVQLDFDEASTVVLIRCPSGVRVGPSGRAGRSGRRIVWAGRAGLLGMRAGRIYRRPRGRAGSVGRVSGHGRSHR